MQPPSYKFHRRSRRIKIGQPVRLCPTDKRGSSFEEIATTANVSRGGFYFVTKQQIFLEGLRLKVTLPYHSPSDFRNREYLGQVLRVEILPDGQRGVAVQLLSSATSGPGSSSI
jgi:hypothetical protein